METAKFMMTKAYTGHDHYGSPYESFDECGTCSGAKCDWCSVVYWIEEFDDLGILDQDPYIAGDDYDYALNELRTLEAKAIELGYEIEELSDRYLEAYVKPKKRK